MDEDAYPGEVDTEAAAAFIARVAPLFEGAPRFLARLASARPFGSWTALFDAARSLAHAMPEAEQVALVDAHPRLGAPPELVSKLSFGEQGYDRDVAGTMAADAARERERLATELERLNRAYEARFGFRYCVFVAGRSRAELLPGMADALGRERDSELRRALDAVVDIARARHEAIG
ncbi:MAG: 2-oxo-4-hydroxy-4-carboxy-5-ureidoimidazoline decarboxylase [Chloroflexi bacterium]|nr:2-oxo-4-hydroxy-4-carboxy-5-ureidoimidazoline decarboxylase [Chloroflexota bacterium]